MYYKKRDKYLIIKILNYEYLIPSMSQIKIDLNVLKDLTNFEAATYFAILSTMNEEGKSNSTINDIARILGVSNVIGKNLKKFKDKDYIQITKGSRADGKAGSQNYYSYSIPDRCYITIDSQILELPVTPIQLGVLLKLKAYTLISTNIIPFDITTISRDLKINRKAVRELQELDIIQEAPLGFRLVDKSIFLIN